MADQGRLVKMWLRKSSQDLQTAKLLLAQNSEVFWGPLVFHTQQSTEKAIKGYLAFKKNRFPKTHDLDILISLVAKNDQELSIALGPTKILTQYAVVYRYPEESEQLAPLNQKLCENLVGMAESVYFKLSKECGL